MQYLRGFMMRWNHQVQASVSDGEDDRNGGREMQENMTSLITSFARRPIWALMMFMTGYFVSISLCNHVNCHHNTNTHIVQTAGHYAHATF
jgi:hypothetical protein